MRRSQAISSSVLLLCALGPSAFAGGGPDAFPRTDLMRIGVYYYPEAWPSNQWARDIANIKKLNLEFVHLGEFAWAFMEPTEGKFNFDWLERNVQLCAEQGLKVVLCTPSPTPPAWLAQNHPEILMVDAKGRKMLHGTRQQACWSVQSYRDFVGRIVDELGKRFGNDPRVWGWQLDNELSHYGKEPCFCDACQTKFRAWLKNKHGTIENLNRDWGNAFWSQMYQNFDQIRLPNKEELVAQINEHALLDAQRWFAEEAADYLRFQTGVLRKHCGDRQWITSNFMHLFGAVNPALLGKDFGPYPFLVVPACQLVDEKLVQRWRAYAAQGGHLILTCRTGQKDRRGHLWEGPWAAPILDLIGAKIKFYDTLPAPNSGQVKAGSRTYDWVSWAEVLEPNEDTTIVAKHANQFYAGKPAAVTRKFGRGSVTYIGVDSVNGGLEAQLVRNVFERARVSVENLADGFLVDWRDGFWIATNFTEKTRRAPIPKNARILIGSREVPTAGVTVWQE